MNKDTEEKVVMLLRTLSEKKNWKLIEHKDIKGNWLWNDLIWSKEHHDPMYVAQDLLNEIEEK